MANKSDVAASKKFLISDLSLNTSKMHKTLEQQLRRHSSESHTELPTELIEAIDRAYHRADVVEAELRAQIQEGRELQAVGRISGGIAHDFNNLLTVIKGYCDLGLRLSHQDEGPVLQALQQISEATERAAEMTVQLLALSRRRKPEPVQLNLNRVLDELQPMLRRLVPDKSSIHIHLSEAPAPILVDRGRLQQMLLNTVISAFETLPEPGTVSIRVTNWDDSPELHAPFENSEPARNGVLLVVEMPDAMTLKPGSSGGQTALQNLVQELNGELIFSSGEHPKSYWIVCLPRHQMTAVELPAASPSSSLSSARILVVEDEEPVRLMLEALLTDQGHSVTLAPGAEDALAHFRTHSNQIDLLVTDIVMPGMHGPKMAQVMKQDRPDLAVLFISGYDPDARERRGAPAPGGAFLQKPFDAATLNLKIREVLSSP